jgi:type IV pilus assembly protein PilC
VVVGENSGTLEDALDEIAHFAEDDLNRRVTVLSKLFEPAVIVVVGVVVGLVFITCFQTIYAYLPNG